ncbi:MAG: DUF1365 domain-containing protein [Pseudomonadota bacterium]
MKSCIYKGLVSHQRYTPRAHGFTYSLFMMFVDLDELPTLFNKILLWSVNKPNLASFYRRDHHGENPNLADSIRALVKDKTGDRITGPIRLLTHFRYFGYVFNPLSVYFCYDPTGDQVTHVVAEVMNTPWKEQHCYVLANENKNETVTSVHQKEFHVSPFLNMDMEYRWKIQKPDEHMNIQIENWADSNKVFDASIYLHQVEFNTRNLRNVLFNFPLMTLKITTLIHFEALKLWIKGIQFIPHPKHQ